MVLANPKVLAFDVGFQLSFLALLGIACLAPVVRQWLGRIGEEGVFRWRTMLSETAAAQLAVAPLLIAQFGSVSLTSLIANLAVLWVIPYTMGMGFMVAALGMIHEVLAGIGGWLLWVPLRYELTIIRVMSALSLPLAFGVSWFGALLYYGVVALGAWWTYHRYGTREKL
jgi:competence protein ComEC